MIAGRQRHFGHAAETRSALALAVLTMTALLLAADRIALWDLGVLKRRVERLFQVTLTPAAESKPADYDAEAPARLNEEVRREKMRELFKFPAEVDTPRETPLTLSPLGAQPSPLMAPLFSRSHIPQREAPPPDLPLVALRPSLRQPAEIRLEDFYGNGHLMAPMGKPGNDIFQIPDGEEGNAPQPAIPEPISASTILAIPESAGAASRKLVEERPAEGYPSLDEDVDARFIVYHPPDAAEAYFELTLALKPGNQLPTLAKDVLFLVDISQSISNAELRLVREAAVKYLARLSAEDGWNVMVFSEQTETLIADTAFAPASRFKAEEVRKFIDRRAGQRRTDVFQVTRQILASLPRSERPCNVFLLSDGKPTQGISDVHSIVHDFARIRRDNFSIFTFDAGPGGNQYLLRLLAYRSRGFAAFCAQTEMLIPALLDFLHRFDAPVLTHVVWSHTGQRAREVYPPILPNLYRDHPITIWGKTTPGRTVAIRIAGLTAGGPREFFFRAVVPEGDDRSPEVMQRWAESQCHELIAQLAEQPEDEELRQRILNLARLHRLTYIVALLEEKPFLPWPWR